MRLGVRIRSVVGPTGDVPYEVAGAVIRNARRRQRVSLRSLADAVGVSASFLSLIEYGEARCSPEHLRALFDGLCLPVPEQVDVVRCYQRSEMALLDAYQSAIHAVQPSLKV